MTGSRSGRRRTVLLAVPAAVAALSTGVALASGGWLTTGSGAGATSATRLAAPAAGNGTTVTTSTVTVAVTTKPSSGPTPTAYRVDRTSTVTPGAQVDACTITATNGLGSCQDTGLTSGTAYTYAVFSRIGANWVSSTSLAVNATTTADTTPPTTTASLSPAANGNGWNKSNVVVNFSATDNTGGSGVKSITYSATGAQTITQTTVNGSTASTPAITTEGTTTVTYYATDNAGNVESANTISVKLDKTAPTNGLSLVNQTGGSFLTGTTIYYRGTAAGSFALSNAVVDALSGPASSSTAALGGTTTGWSHTPSTVSTPAGGPFVSNPFSWTAGTTSAPTEVVTSKDMADNSASTAALTYTNDSTAPVNGAFTVNGTAASGAGSSSTTSSTSFALTGRTDYTDAGSGISSSRLTVQSTTFDGTNCGAAGSGGPFTTATTVTGTTQPSGIQAGYCYVYTLTGTDNVGNTASVSSTVAVTLSYSFAVTGVGSPTAGTAVTGVQVQLQVGGANTTSYYGTAFTGSKAVTVTGLSNSPNGTAPTVPTTATFTNGLATISVTPVKAETTALTVATTTPAVSGTSASFTVAAGTAATMSFTNCSISGGSTIAVCTSAALGNSGGYVDAHVSVTDSLGNVAKVASGTNWTVSLSSNNSSQFAVTNSPVTITGPASESSTTFRVTHSVNSSGSATITAHVTAGTALTDATLSVTK